MLSKEQTGNIGSQRWVNARFCTRTRLEHRGS